MDGGTSTTLVRERMQGEREIDKRGEVGEGEKGSSFVLLKLSALSQAKPTDI